MQIAIISDTHMPRGERRLPVRCVELLEKSALIIHAGDFMRVEILREIERYGRVVGVHGNVDEASLRMLLPMRTEVPVGEGVRIGVIHDAGPSGGRLARLRRSFPRAAAVVFGHSHIALHETGEDGFQIFNPGSPTERRRSPGHTMGIARLEGGRLSFQLVALD